MAQLPDETAETPTASASPTPAPRDAERVNWLPTLIALAAFCAWEVVSFLLRFGHADMGDVFRAIEYALLAACILTAIPTLGLFLGRRMPDGLRRGLTAAVCFVLLVPVGFGLVWALYDTLTPVVPRSSGKLPELGLLLGRSQHDAERLLGENRLVLNQSVDENSDVPVDGPQGIAPAKYAVYTLPDLNTIGSRSVKEASRKSEASRLGPGFDVASWDSDAILIVYLSSDGRVIGARLDISGMEARRAGAFGSAGALFDAMGVESEDASASPATDAVAGSGEASGAITVPVSSATTATAAGSTGVSAGEAAVVHGIGHASGRAVTYQLTVGGLADFMSPRITTGLGSDAGDITLTIGDRQIGTSSSTGSSTHTSDYIAASSEDGPIYVGDQSYVDRPMYVILCSQTYDTEEAALTRAYRLNGDSGRIHFTVERSGHLTGLGFTDYFVVIYDVAYVNRDDADKAKVVDSAGMPVLGTKIVQVTKVCGERTIAKLVE